MKQLFRSLLFVAACTGIFAGCSKGNESDPLPAAPSMVWTGNDLEAVHEITDQMSIKIDILVPGGLKTLALEIDSPALTSEILGLVGLSQKMDLTNPATPAMEEALKGLGLPAGKGIIGSAKQVFNISELVPMIKALYSEDSEHRFKVTITDVHGQSITKTLRFHLGAAAPSLVWEGQDLEAVHEIKDQMSINIDILVPGGLKTLALEIDSPALTSELLGLVGLAPKMELTNPATPAMEEALKGFNLPAGKEIVGTKKQVFNISELVPMIKAIYQETSEHRFKVIVTDALNQSITKTLRFQLNGPVLVTYNDDADLWNNTATLSVMNMPADAKVQYRVKGGGATDWIDATAGADKKFSLAPVWESSKNAANLDVHKIKAGTGVFAAKTYECRMVKGAEVLATSEFSTSAGDVIPNGNMSGWSKKTVEMGSTFLLTYPNPEGQSNWDSGNNPFLENPTSDTWTPLCEEDKDEAGVAKLSARMVLGFVFAPGNMFTGDFNYTGMSGTVGFGKAYAWNARPRALKLRYKATVGIIDKLGANDPNANDYKDQPDRSRVFVAVVDWNAQHGVTSGMVEPTGMWDPATTKSVDEGPILGYGDLVITKTTDTWVEVTLPINWYVKNAAKPGAEKFSLVISCATSMRGDYLTGCSTNVMRVDDFEWVY